MSARDGGMPALRIVSLPSIDYYPNRQTVEGLRKVTADTFDNVIEALTKPLTAEEKSPVVPEEETRPASVEVTGDSYGEALTKVNELFFEYHWGDGLPLVPPTPEAVKQMLTGTTYAPNKVIGRVPFRMGEATVEKIAINAVMAGAKPEYLPVIIAAMEAFCDNDAFYSHALSSEGSFTCSIIVSGPIGKEIGMGCGVGLLGHCQPANNTIGRAVRLNLITLGHIWPGVIDMALIGRPSPHTFYTFAENMDESPWESFNEGLGGTEEDSSVMVDTVGGAAIGMHVYGGGVVEPWNLQEVLDNLRNEVASDRAVLGAYKVGVANPMAHMRKHIMIIHPEMAIVMKQNGFATKASLRDYLYENTMVPYEELTPEEISGIEARMNTKPGGVFFNNDAFMGKHLEAVKSGLKPGGKIPVISPDDIHIVVSGAIPGYSFGLWYFRTAHKTIPVKGAVLTRAGK